MRENASDQVAIGLSFASDWLRGWREFSRPITERSKAKPMQSRITFDTQLKIALLCYVIRLENSRHPRSQSDAKLKAIATWSVAFSRAWGRLHVFTLSSHWLLVIFTFVLIGRCDYFDFGFTTLNQKAL